MQIVTKHLKPSWGMKGSLKLMKQKAHRAFRHNVKIAVNCGREINWKPRLID
jgi:hypothetical protein